MNENYPEQNTPEYEQMMRQHYGENYELGFRVGFGKRLGAFVLDLLFLMILSLIIMTITGVFDEFIAMAEQISKSGSFDFSIMQNLEENYPGIEAATLWNVIAALLYWAIEGMTGASPAKHALGLMIGSENRNKANSGELWSRFLYKNLNTIFSLLFVLTATYAFDLLSSLLSLAFFIGCFFVLGVRRQSFHDILSKTAVFHKDVIN
jgi:uncharacterized RDD family membrane protein YckC